MSKFKKGDTVRLSPKSGWVNAYSITPESANPLNVEGVIDEVDEYDTGNEYVVMWSNGRHNTCYIDHDLILVVKEQEHECPIGDEAILSPDGWHECPYDVIEELQAHVETLEEALEKVTKELIELREKQSVSTDTAFKPIPLMTLADWQQAKSDGWEFICRGGHTVTIDEIDGYNDYRPIVCSNGWWHHINGMWDESCGKDEDDIIARIN